MPDVGFRLFGDSVELERAVKRGKANVEDLHGEIRHVNRTFKMLGELAGGLGIMEIFKSAAEDAVKMRENAEKMGRALSDAEQSAVDFGSGFSFIAKSIENLPKDFIRGFAIVGGAIGDVINRIRFGNEAAADFTKSEKGAMEAILRIERARAAAIDEGTAALERSAAKNKETTTLSEKNRTDEAAQWLNNQNSQKQIQILLSAQAGLEAMIASDATDALDREKMKANLIKVQNDLKEKQGKIEDDAKKKSEKDKADKTKRTEGEKRISDAQGEVSKARTNLETAQNDRSSLTLEELAGKSQFSAGVSVDIGNQGKTAREVLDIQTQANAARVAGDVEGSKSLFSKADELRGGLTALKSGERDPMGTYKAALKDSEEKLEAIKIAVSGKFIAQ